MIKHDLSPTAAERGKSGLTVEHLVRFAADTRADDLAWSPCWRSFCRHRREGCGRVSATGTQTHWWQGWRRTRPPRSAGALDGPAPQNGNIMSQNHPWPRWLTRYVVILVCVISEYCPNNKPLKLSQSLVDVLSVWCRHSIHYRPRLSCTMHALTELYTYAIWLYVTSYILFGLSYS